MANLTYERRLTRVVDVGGVKIGGDNRVSIQSMVTAETQNVPAVVDQIIKLHQADAEIIRITTPTMQDAQALGDIRRELRSKYQDVPLVADVHHNGTQIAIEASKHVHKVRLNPGLNTFHKRTGKDDYTQNENDEARAEIETRFTPVLKNLKERGVALRIGVNHGSLSERLMVMYGDTPEGMAESVFEYLQISEANNFKDIVISVKASRTRMMLAANRLLAQRLDERGMNYPIHLGVTEAGEGDYARVKSAIGIGSLLAEGIGDTIRVSLTEDPVNEIAACKNILQAVGLRKSHCEIISCPGCGRTKFDLPNVTLGIKHTFSHLTNLDIAVMGCIVNGPGEMADSDYGYVGKGGGMIALYRGKKEIEIVPQEIAEEALKTLIKLDGKWVDPPIISSENQLRVLNSRPTFK